MKRKLVKQGAATLMVSIPSKWLKENNLRKGDEVIIDENESRLVLRKGDAKKTKKKITLNITEENKEDIWWILSLVYRRGFDIITLNNVDNNLLSKIKQIAKDLLLGFEITERADEKCRLENISEPTQEKYSTLLRRSFLIIKETQNMIMEDFQSGIFSRLDEITDLKNQQDKFILFCRRILHREKCENHPMLKWELLSFLVHIQHENYYLYKYCSENNVKSSKNLVLITKEMQDYFNLFYDSYFKKDISLIHNIQNLKKKFQYGKCHELIQRSKGKNSVVYSYIRSIFRRIQVATSPVMAEILEDSIEN